MSPVIAFRARAMLRLCLTVVTAFLAQSFASAEPNDEYRLKAAFLFNFTRFVEWPPQAFKTAGEPISICILGKNALDEALTEAVRGKTIQDRTFAIVPISDPAQAQSCQILFVSSSERKRLPAILHAVGGRGVLTVGETDSFTAEGGVIGLKLDDRKIHIQINPDAAEQQHIRISSKLLTLAEIVRGAK